MMAFFQWLKTFFLRLPWIAIWLGGEVIYIWLCLDMAEDQPVMFAIIVVASLVVSLSLVYWRLDWRHGSRKESSASLLIGGLALAVCVIAGTSFWSATIKGVQDQVVREKASAAALDQVMARRRRQLANDPGERLPSQIEAEIQNASKAKLPALRAELKASRDLEALSAQIFDDSKRPVVKGIKRSLFDAAQMGSDIFGGSVENWVVIIVLILETYLQAILVLAPYIAFAPRAPREAKGRDKVSPPISVPPQPIPAPEALALAFVAPEEPEPAPVTPPEPPKGPKPEEVTEPVSIEPIAPVRPTEPFIPRVVENVAKPLSKEESDKLELEAINALTRKWAKARGVSAVMTTKEGTQGAIAYDDIVAYAKRTGQKKPDRSWFGRSMKDCGFEIAHNGKGAVYKIVIAKAREAAA